MNENEEFQCYKCGNWEAIVFQIVYGDSQHPHWFCGNCVKAMV